MKTTLFDESATRGEYPNDQGGLTRRGGGGGLLGASWTRPTSCSLSGMLFEHTHEGEKSSFVAEMGDDRLLTVAFSGTGEMSTTRAFVETMDKLVATHGSGGPIRFAMDLREFEKSPLRAQVMLGRWLMSNKTAFSKIAVFGGKPAEIKMATGIGKIAGFDALGAFATKVEADAFLGA